MIEKPETDLKIPRAELIIKTPTGRSRCETQLTRQHLTLLGEPLL